MNQFIEQLIEWLKAILFVALLCGAVVAIKFRNEIDLVKFINELTN